MLKRKSAKADRKLARNIYDHVMDLAVANSELGPILSKANAPTRDFYGRVAELIGARIAEREDLAKAEPARADATRESYALPSPLPSNLMLPPLPDALSSSLLPTQRAATRLIRMRRADFDGLDKWTIAELLRIVRFCMGKIPGARVKEILFP